MDRVQSHLNQTHLQSTQALPTLKPPRGLKDTSSVLKQVGKPLNEPTSQPHWAQMPVIISLEAFPEKSSLKDSSKWLLKEALQQWTAASAGKLLFVQTSHLNSHTKEDWPGIVISWTDTPTLGRDYEVGHTLNQVNNQAEIQHSHIELLTAPAIDQTLSPVQQQQRLLATYLHELGHALGLEHNHQSKAVMHYRGWKNTQLHSADIKTLQQLYS